MRTKHKRTLKDIFHDPILSNVKWKDVESLFEALGAEVEEGALVLVRKFLMEVGIIP